MPLGAGILAVWIKDIPLWLYLVAAAITAAHSGITIAYGSGRIIDRETGGNAVCTDCRNAAQSIAGVNP